MPDKNEGEPPPLPEDLPEDVGSGGGVFAFTTVLRTGAALFGGGMLPFTLRGGPLVLRGGGRELRTTSFELFGIGGGIGGELGAEAPPFPVACCNKPLPFILNSRFSESSRRTVAFLPEACSEQARANAASHIA